MTTLVLLHGAWHGAWCWEPLRAELGALGLSSVAMDLPAGEPQAGAARYAEVAAAAVDSAGAAGGDLVVVPHSLAGLYAPVVAARIGARAIVNLAALTPEPGSSGLRQSRSLPDIYCEAYRAAPMARHDDGSTSVPEAIGRELMYHDCAEEQVRWALPQLRRQFWTPWTEDFPLAEWPSGLAYAHIACEGDRVLGAVGMVDGARRTSAPLAWIPGGHVPMVSHPAEAAAALRASLDGLG